MHLASFHQGQVTYWLTQTQRTQILEIEKSINFSTRLFPRQSNKVVVVSSVARGGRGGLEPPPLACEVCKIARFCCFLGRFLVKNWKQPPKGNWVPKLWSRCRESVWKSVWMCDFGRKIRFNFGEDLFFFFFFLETTCFWAEKTFELSAFREISSQFSDKPCETDSRTMKIRVKVVCTFLTLSTPPPPPLFQILATRLVVVSTDNFIASKENSQSKAFRKTNKNGVNRVDRGRRVF